MALRGNLRDFSLPDVFQLVTFSRKTGVLRITRSDGAEGSVWFREGDVFFASSNWHSEPLGERLVRAQRITPQALVRALELRRADVSGRRLGTILVDEGYITHKVLEAFVTEQIQDTIFDLMRWEEGEFDFEAMPETVDEDIGLTVSIENVVMEGSRRLEEWGRIRKKIPSTEVVFKMATAPGEGTFEISLKPVEWQLLLMIDGTRSVADLAVESGRTDFEVARILYGLFSAGLLEFATDEEIESARAERAVREEKRAAADAERARAVELQKREALEREARLADEARKRQEETAKAAEPKPQLTVESDSPAATPSEVPEFLGGPSGPVTVDDQAALEAFMGAVLEPAAPGSPSPAPAAESAAYRPAEEPAFIAGVGVDSSQDDLASVEELLGELVSPVELEPEPEPAAEPEPEPAAEPEPEPAAEPEPVPETQSDAEPASGLEPSAAPETGAFAADLLSLGLGELPSDLLEPVTAEPPVVVPHVEPEAVSEPMSMHEAAGAWTGTSEEDAAFDAADKGPDFSSLLESLDVDHVEGGGGGATPAESGFDVDLLLEDETTQPGGVISTDAFLEDVAIEDLGLTGGLTDELSALTGAARRPATRPQANVNAIPADHGETLSRDTRVDRETVLKIIEGIKNL